MQQLRLFGLTTLAALLTGCGGGAMQTGSHEAISWATDFEAAREEAADRNVPILADFTGSDWCGWCIKLKKEVFSQDTFAAFAKDNVVLFMADFPRRTAQDAATKEQNEALAKQYGIRGYPTILMLDADGKELARTGYRPGGAEAYVEHLKALLPAGN